MIGTSFTIELKTSKSGDKFYYLKLCDGNRYPIEKFDVDEQDQVLIFLPCTYYPKSLYDSWGEHGDGMLGLIESLSANCGKVAVVDDEKIPRLSGMPRLVETYTVVDGSIAFVLDKDKSEAHFEICVKE